MGRLVEEWQAQEHWIVSVRKPVHAPQLISASVNGEVLWWDLRNSKALLRYGAFPSCGITGMEVHGEGALTMVASGDHHINVYDSITSATMMNSISSPECVGVLKCPSTSPAVEGFSSSLAGFWGGSTATSHATNSHASHHQGSVVPTALAWHPRRLLCAVASSEGSLSLYSMRHHH